MGSTAFHLFSTVYKLLIEEKIEFFFFLFLNFDDWKISFVQKYVYMHVHVGDTEVYTYTVVKFFPQFEWQKFALFKYMYQNFITIIAQHTGFCVKGQVFVKQSRLPR